MRLLPFLAFTLAITCIFGQSITELESKLPSLKDTARAKALNQLALEYSRTDSAKSLQYADDALELSKELEFEEGVARALRNQALARYFGSNNKRFFQLM